MLMHQIPLYFVYLHLRSGLYTNECTSGDQQTPCLSELLLQPLGFGTGFWRMEAMAKQSSGAPEASAQLTAAMVLGVTLVSSTWAATAQLDLNDIGYTLTHSWRTVAVLAWAGVVTSAATNVLEAMALAHVSASECMVILSSEPLWTTLFAMVALEERFSTGTALGATLITAACLWSALGTTVLN